MKQVFFFTLIILLASCQGSKKVNLDKLDRGNPKSVAIAVLKSYQNQDLKTLEILATPRNAQSIKRMRLSEKLVEKRRIYNNNHWENVKAWNGKIIEVRFSDDLQKAYAMFNETKENNEIAVVEMLLQKKQWNFDNISLYTKESFDTLEYIMEE